MVGTTMSSFITTLMRYPTAALSAITAGISFFFFRDREVPSDQLESSDPAVIQYVLQNLFIFL